MTTSTPDAVTQIKDQHRAVWAAGRYADVAELVADAAPAQLLSLAGIQPGQAVLDVATGTGNVALEAAGLGAHVTGLDLVPHLLDIARSRDDGRIAWIEGDAEALPFADANFDRVLVLGKYMPKPPAFASPPPLWGSEEHQRSLFAAHAVSLEFSRGVDPFRFPSVEEYMTFFEERYGPTIKAKAKLLGLAACSDPRAALPTRHTRAVPNLALDSEERPTRRPHLRVLGLSRPAQPAGARAFRQLAPTADPCRRRVADARDPSSRELPSGSPPS